MDVLPLRVDADFSNTLLAQSRAYTNVRAMSRKVGSLSGPNDSLRHSQASKTARSVPRISHFRLMIRNHPAFRDANRSESMVSAFLISSFT